MRSTKIKPVAPDDAAIINESQALRSANVLICKLLLTSKEGEPARGSVYSNNKVSYNQSSDPVILMVIA